MTQELFQAGVELFNKHDFFDCHDAWEELLMETSGHPKKFYQGMIQIAVGYYHALNRNYSGAASLHRKGLEKLTRYAPFYEGIPLGQLLPVWMEHQQLFGKQTRNSNYQFDESTIPRIVLSGVQGS
jgi:uncharacterized protein